MKVGRTRSLSWTFILATLALVGIIASVVENIMAPADLASNFMLSSWIITAGSIGVARPKTSPAYHAPFYLAVFCVEFLNILGAGLPRAGPEIPHYVACAAAFGSLTVILIMRLRSPDLSDAGISGVGDVPSSDLRSPEDNLRLWQFLSISWMFPLIRVGKQRTLNEDDVWYLAYEFQHGRLFDKFSSLSGTVVRRLLKANGLDVCILTLSASTETVCCEFRLILVPDISAPFPRRPEYCVADPYLDHLLTGNSVPGACHFTAAFGSYGEPACTKTCRTDIRSYHPRTPTRRSPGGSLQHMVRSSMLRTKPRRNDPHDLRESSIAQECDRH